MDEFDILNQNTRNTESGDEQNTESEDKQNTNDQEADLFRSGFTDNIKPATSTNPFSNVQQDISWDMNDDLANKSTTTSENNLFDDDTLLNFASGPQTTSFDDDLFTNQSNTNELNSLSTTNLPLTADELLDNDSSRPPSENSISFNMFPNPVPSSSSSSTNTYQLNSSENLSPLEAFHIRRQQEIAEMDAIEKQKIEELRQQGKKELERWYEDRRTRMEQKRQSIQHEETTTVTQALEKSDKNTCDWAKVIRFLDFSQGTQITKQKRELNRMRAVIIQAKRDKESRISENGV